MQQSGKHQAKIRIQPAENWAWGGNMGQLGLGLGLWGSALWIKGLSQGQKEGLHCGRGLRGGGCSTQVPPATDKGCAFFGAGILFGWLLRGTQRKTTKLVVPYPMLRQTHETEGGWSAPVGIKRQRQHWRQPKQQRQARPFLLRR